MDEHTMDEHTMGLPALPALPAPGAGAVATHRTIGVAIALPEPWAGTLRDIRAQAGDPAAAHVPTHLTLLCPAEVAVADGDRIDRHLDAVGARTAPFDLWLRGAGSVRPLTPVVYVPVASGGPQCTQLAARVRSGPLDRQLRFPYHPHVTVAQEVPGAALDRAYRAVAGFSVRLRVDAFTVYYRDGAGEWRVHREVALAGVARVPAQRSAGYVGRGGVVVGGWGVPGVR